MFFFKNEHKSLIKNMLNNDLDDFIKNATAKLLSKKFEYEQFEAFNLLLLATYLGKNEFVTFIVKNHQTLINDYDESGRTALHLAVRTKNLGVAKTLIEHGANPDFVADVDDPVSTCLEQCTVSSFDLMKLVIEHSNMIKSNYHTAANTKDMVNPLAGQLLKILYGTLEMKLPDDADLQAELLFRLKYLQSINCDFNIKLEVETIGYVHFYTMPIQENHKDILEYLLQNNVNPNVENIFCGYACDYAVSEQQEELVPIIQKYGGMFANKEMEDQYSDYLSNRMTFGDL